MITISILSDTDGKPVAFQTLRVDLDGSLYQLALRWNARLGWVLDVSDVSGAVLVAGIVLVSNRRLLRRHRYVPGLPPGDLMAADLTGSIPLAGFEDLGSVVELVYFTAAEL